MVSKFVAEMFRWRCPNIFSARRPVLRGMWLAGRCVARQAALARDGRVRCRNFAPSFRFCRIRPV